MTPEGEVKSAVKTILDKNKPHVYYHMPVQWGVGKPTLDFVGCCCGAYFTIETKAPGKVPTPIQMLTMEKVADAGGTVFIIDASEGLPIQELDEWVQQRVLAFTSAGRRWW